MSRTKKLPIGVVVVGVLGSIGGWVTFAAFTATTSNTGNAFAAGTVNIGDNDAGAVMYSVTNRKPGDSVSQCIKITYSGSLAADVKMYASAVDTLGQYVNLTVTPGSGNPTFPGCVGFTADASGAIYTGTLKGFADTHSSFANGLADFPGAQTSWNQNDAVVYQFTLTLQDNNNANGVSAALSTGTHSFTWESRNQ